MDLKPELGGLKDGNGDLAIHRAAADGQIECIKHLCKPDTVNIPGAQRKSALHHAIIQDSIAVTEYLLKHGADVNGSQSLGLYRSPLMEALQWTDTRFANILLDFGADKESTDEDAWRPLHYAAYNGSEGLARRLLDAGCTTEAQTNLGETPFFLAVSQGHTDVIRLFLAKGIGSVTIQDFAGSTYAHIAAKRGRLDVLQHLVRMDKNVIFITDSEGNDALNFAAAMGHYRVVDFLIWAGIKPDGRGLSQSTPLGLAASFGNVKTTDLLLSMGAKVNLIDKWMRPALLWAVERGRSRIVHRLLKAGANPCLRDATGFSAFDYSVNSPVMMGVIRPWSSTPDTNSFGHGYKDRVHALAYCISRFARALAEPKGDPGPVRISLLSAREDYLYLLLSTLRKLALIPFTPPPHSLETPWNINRDTLDAVPRLQKICTAVPVKKTEILREWRIFHADSEFTHSVVSA